MTDTSKRDLAEELRKRDELILGNPMRMDPPSEISDEMRAMALPPPGYGRPGEFVGIFGLLLHAPDLLRLFREIGTYFLTSGSLIPKDREIAILRVAWLTRSPYEWGEHVSVSKRRTGMTSEEIANIQIGSSAPVWGKKERAILKAVEELFADAMICDTTWAEIRDVFDDKQIVELIVLIGQYQTTANFLNTMRIPLREGTQGMKAV
jgi:4-carboxymuconolactone decarboxylase